MKHNNHDYVDLGLPSGTLWATCNVGANSPEEYGDYFAWGETETKDNYDCDTYKWGTAAYDTIFNGWYLETLTKYNTDSGYGTVDNKTTLTLADDAARANWGGKWRMPTDAEWEELMNSCTWTWTTLNGVKGYTVNKIKKNMKALNYYIENYYTDYMRTHTQVFLELSDKQTMFCCCGKLATGLHERTCRKFNAMVNKETLKRLEQQKNENNYDNRTND